jgi:hypothetical protein
MSKKYEEQARSRAVGVTTGSILAVIVAMSLYMLVDLGTDASRILTAAATMSVPSIA